MPELGYSSRVGGDKLVTLTRTCQGEGDDVAVLAEAVPARARN